MAISPAVRQRTCSLLQLSEPLKIAAPNSTGGYQRLKRGIQCSRQLWVYRKQRAARKGCTSTKTEEIRIWLCRSMAAAANMGNRNRPMAGHPRTAASRRARTAIITQAESPAAYTAHLFSLFPAVPKSEIGKKEAAVSAAKLLTKLRPSSCGLSDSKGSNR